MPIHVLCQHPNRRKTIVMYTNAETEERGIYLEEPAVAFLDAVSQINTPERLNVSDDSVAGVNTLPEPFHEINEAAPVHGGLHHHHEIVERHGCSGYSKSQILS